jgi:hypothetical protein
MKDTWDALEAEEAGHHVGSSGHTSHQEIGGRVRLFYTNFLYIFILSTETEFFIINFLDS